MDTEQDNAIEQAKREILEEINKAKLSILRGMHSGDKVANILVNLVEEMHKTCLGQTIITCVECGSSRYHGLPEEVILETDAFKEADAYVLRIKTIRDSKEKT